MIYKCMFIYLGPGLPPPPAALIKRRGRKQKPESSPTDNEVEPEHLPLSYEASSEESDVDEGDVVPKTNPDDSDFDVEPPPKVAKSTETGPRNQVSTQEYQNQGSRPPNNRKCGLHLFFSDSHRCSK